MRRVLPHSRRRRSQQSRERGRDCIALELDEGAPAAAILRGLPGRSYVNERTVIVASWGKQSKWLPLRIPLGVCASVGLTLWAASATGLEVGEHASSTDPQQTSSEPGPAEETPSVESSVAPAKGSLVHPSAARRASLSKRHEASQAEQRVQKTRARKKRRSRQEKRRSKAQEPLPRPPAPRMEPPLPELVDHRSALERQLQANWGFGSDRDRQVRVPLVDRDGWQRIRLWNIDHLTAFRYTRQHHAITTLFTVSSQERLSSQSCMEQFEREGEPSLKRWRVRLKAVEVREALWRGAPVLVHRTEGSVPFLLSRYEFSAAWAAYPAYEGGCLIAATVVLWDGRPQLAGQVVDRWIAEGVAQFEPRTKGVPFRH